MGTELYIGLHFERDPHRHFISTVNDVKDIMVLYGKTRATLHLDLKKKSALIFNYLLKFAEDSLLDMVFYVNADGGIPDTFYSRMSRVYKEQPVIYPRGVLNRLWLSEKDKDKIREIFSVSG